MERNKWETAIRCLEIALHPNTSDEEIVAAVNGFRRVARGTPLSELYAGTAAPEGGRVVDFDGARRQAKFERAIQENFELRLQVKFEQGNRDVAARRLRRAEHQIDRLSDELRAAQTRAGDAEQLLAEFRAAYRDMTNRAPRTTAAPAQPASKNVSPFRTVLDAAKQRDGHWEPVTAANRAAGSRAPWTA